MEWIEVPAQGLSLREIRQITSRSQSEDNAIRKSVEAILTAVQEQGDAAVRALTEQFDGVRLTEFRVTPAEIAAAVETVGPDFMQVLTTARDNIKAYHERQIQDSWFDTFRDGVKLGARYTPIQRVGVYVPGGTAAYPSTVLMDTVPAAVAGVPSIAVFTPPAKDGSVNPYILAAAHVAGATEIYKVGGAQSIAAAAYGTESIPPVFKIVGPGNAYVAMAKRLVFGTVGIDMIAGPSEVGILADEQANPAWVAADLLAQAEHDRRAAVFLATPSAAFAGAVEQEVERQLEELPRKEIAAASIKDHGKIFITADRSQAIEIMNLIAPEHLEIDFPMPEQYIPQIINAGAIFLGPYTPEPIGDYFAGPNHTLPTMGTAAFSSPLGVYDFVKRSSLLSYSKQAFDAVADQVMQFAEVEGLQAHGRAVKGELKMENKWLRDTIRDFEPYKVPEIQEHTIINANESPYNILDFPSVKQDFYAGLEKLPSYRYPDPFAEDLRRALSEYAGCRPEEILATNGGDEIINLILNTFINLGDQVLTHSPTFDVYGIDAAVLGGRMLYCPDEDGFVRNASAFKQMIVENQPKVTIICNPNNPTGHIWPTSVIEEFVRAAHNIVVVDEAYLEFANQESVIPLIEKYENLIVIRTLSKAFGLAGFRLGYGVARADMIDALSLTKLSYNLNSVTQLMGIVAMRHRDEVLGHNVPPTIENREYLEENLNALPGVTAYPSASNFILVRVPDGPALIQALKQADICVRFYGAPSLKNCIRISVTTRDVADRLLTVFRALMKGE